jgi:elongation factor Tu
MKQFSFILSFLFLLTTSFYGQKPVPTAVKQPFLMAVEDAFYIAGRGVVATGTIERGALKTGDAVELVGIKPNKPTTVVAIEMFRKIVPEAKAGDSVGLVLRGVEKTDVERGMMIAKPGTVRAYTNIKARIDLLATSEGGRPRPLPNESRMLIEFRGKGISGKINFTAGRTEIVSGAKGVDVAILLEQPVAMEKGQQFAILDGGRTIGTGTVTTMTP